MTTTLSQYCANYRVVFVVAVLLITSQFGCQRPRATNADPTEAEVPLGARAGWNAYLTYASDVGVWTVKVAHVHSHYGAPQIIALDDKGRCTILMPYSGKWTPAHAAFDGTWLGGLAHADVDALLPAAEIYAGAKRGNIYQIIPHTQGGFDSRIIAFIPGREVHTLVAADLDPAAPGNELFAFTSPGGLYQLVSVGDCAGTFNCRHLRELAGRVRDAVVVERDDGPPYVLLVSADGTLSRMSIRSGGVEMETIFQTQTGLGRIAVRRGDGQDGLVIYVTADDGRILRMADREGPLDATTIYNGPPGPRGIVSGRLHPDPAVESVAIFGYSGRVELLTRCESSWSAETIFEDTDMGHWLTLGELDGRNETDEIVTSGYSGRVVLLVRP